MSEESSEIINVNEYLNDAKKTLYSDLLPIALAVLKEMMLSNGGKEKLEAARNVLDIIPETSTKKAMAAAIVGETINFNIGEKKLKKIVEELEVIGGDFEDISVEKLESFGEDTTGDGKGGT